MNLNFEAIVGIIFAAVIVGLIATNPAGDTAVLGGLTSLSTGTINSVENTKH